MSQYGALGFANEGWTYDRIIGHFYPGTQLGPSPVTRVRVLIAEAKPSVTISSRSPFRVRDVLGTIYPLAAGSVTLGPKLRITVNDVPTDLPGPVLFLPGTTPLEVGGAYRGQIEVGVSGQKLNAINLVGVEQYLAGVVAREMPSAWPEEALKAQAVAARSYALAHRVGGKPFDLYADVRSQVYGGVAAETARVTAAVQATGGEIALFGGKVISAFFHSTSGGRTADVAEVFGGSVPYLVPVDDPWSSLSPYHRWGPTPVTEAVLRKGLELRTPVVGLKLTRAASGRLASVRVTTAAGETAVSGSTFRRAAGLRSTWLTGLATLSLTRPGGPVVHGRVVTLTGRVQGLRGAELQQRVDGAWRTVAKPADTFSRAVRLTAPATFRLSAGQAPGPVLRVPVAPLVRAARVAGAIAGTVRPPIPGATVELRRLEGDRWLPVASAAADGAGAFRIVLEHEPGSYRARVAPTGGFAEGLSGILRVP
jgi:stage II sporulation protein D